jgi:hypothetical protein
VPDVGTGLARHPFVSGLLVGVLVCALAGGIIAYELSTDYSGRLDRVIADSREGFDRLTRENLAASEENQRLRNYLEDRERILDEASSIVGELEKTTGTATEKVRRIIENLRKLKEVLGRIPTI